MLETIARGQDVHAIILRAGFRKDGIHFVTPDDYPLQLAYMLRPGGYRIPAHVHNPAPRTIAQTFEVLFIRSGKVRVDFYDPDRAPFASRVLEAGDVILLTAGGHGFTVLEEAEIIEAKQGPYLGEHEKARFEPAPAPEAKP